MKLTISKSGDYFIVNNKSRSGSPTTGIGKTMLEAVGSYFHCNQKDLDIEFEVNKSAQPGLPYGPVGPVGPVGPIGPRTKPTSYQRGKS